MYAGSCLFIRGVEIYVVQWSEGFEVDKSQSRGVKSGYGANLAKEELVLAIEALCALVHLCQLHGNLACGKLETRGPKET